MAKNRMVRPEVWTDDKFVSLSPIARLLFIGMWNFACDNGHLDDSLLQLKMRILPGDNCDTESLLAELLALGMVVRENGYLKVVNLSEKQPLDLRFLVFCDHCNHDDERHYSPSDKKPARGQHASNTREPPVRSSGARRSGVGVVDGDGDVIKPAAGAPRATKKATQLPATWAPNERHRDIAVTDMLDLDREAQAFKDHALAHGKTFKDWDAGFRTWLANAVKFRRDEPRPAKVHNLPNARDLELPPDGLSTTEYAAWERNQREKRKRA